MKQTYISPATETMMLAATQLMAGSPTQMGVNDNPLNGDSSGNILYGE